MPQPIELRWALQPFERLSGREVHDLLRLRAEVFVVEQACAFQDVDGADPMAWHLMGWHDDHLRAYARCFAAGVKFAEASVGRIVTCPTVRGQGLGDRLVRRALRAVVQVWGVQPVRIGAQARLQGFYESLGFRDVGRPYDEDGIPHLEMLCDHPERIQEEPGR